jgi:preprotein translocase SecE subunit
VQILDKNDNSLTVATASVADVQSDRLRIKDLSKSAERLPGSDDVVRVSGGPGQAPLFNAVITGSPNAVPLVNPLYVQAGVLSLVVAIGGGMIFWLVGVNKRSAEFLIATDGEMKKVNWSTRKEVIGSTWVVIIACFLLALVLFVFDYVLSNFFRLVGVLEKLPQG